jgi:hypothetical protein
MSGVGVIIVLSTKGKLMAYISSSLVIESLEAKGLDYPYARAFGSCWALLTDEQRLSVLKALDIEPPTE